MVNAKESATEQKILFAARQIFIFKGMAGARMQDIANEAGINKALLHYYFRSKEQLFGVVFKEAIKELIPKVATIISDPGTSLFYKIDKFCDEYITAMEKKPFIPMFVMNEMHKQPDEFLKNIWGDKKPSLRFLADQISEDVRVGRIRAIDPHQLLMNVVSMCVFPFIGRPMWQMITGETNEAFSMMIEQRKKDVPKFVIQALRNW